MTKLTLLVFFISFFILTLPRSYAQEPLHVTALSFFSVLPDTMPASENDTLAQVNLGKKLYFETALSINNTQSCNSCHNIINGSPGVDHVKVSVGALGTLGDRNAPTTWNAGLQIAQFWDGRAITLEQQAQFPIFNVKEMAMSSEQQVIERLHSKDYLADFKSVFPHNISPININNVSKALAVFQRTLISQDRFDDYLAGKQKAITEDEKLGLSVFIEKGCVACHNGSVLGGQLFMKMGIVHPYPNKEDKGKAQVTANPADNYFFKVPSLRNILNTAPYFHDGAANTIEEAIDQTGWHQLGIKLTPKEIEAIKVFFKTLDNQATVITQNIGNIGD